MLGYSDSQTEGNDDENHQANSNDPYWYQDAPLPGDGLLGHVARFVVEAIEKRKGRWGEDTTELEGYEEL